jgi:hypothetical protein
LEHQAAEGSEDGWGDELKKAAPAEEGEMV